MSDSFCLEMAMSPGNRALKLAALFALLSGFLCNSMFGEAASASPKVVIAHGALNARIAPFWVAQDRKSTRLNSSHGSISYAVFCLKKKTANPADRSIQHNS